MRQFDYQIIRRPRRRTASISVKPDCSVRILVPATLSNQKIDELVKRKSRWIRSKITQFQEIQRNNKEKEYVSGECFTYLGRNYRLKVVTGDSEEYPVKLVNGRFYVNVPADVTKKEHAELVKEQLSKWYQEHALIRLREKAKRYAKQMGGIPYSVGIKDYRSRWGSCHTDGRIYFNWRIIVAPHSVVDYVVVHELCHLVHHNHSKKFWKLVSTIIPDYAKRKEWLKINGQRLDV